MTNLNLSIPESMNHFIQEQANQQGYPSPNDYICSLIMQAQKQVEQERLEQLLIAINSPSPNFLTGYQPFNPVYYYSIVRRRSLCLSHC